MKSPIRNAVFQAVLTLSMAAVAFGVARAFLPRLFASVASPATLLAVEPSPAFDCKARKDEVVKATFTVRNLTRADIKILGVRSTCTCTAVATEFPVRLAAGAVTQISMNMTVGDPGPDGKFRRVVDLFVDSEGTVPPLVFEATVSDPTPSS